jgi:hypothetical protein
VEELQNTLQGQLMEVKHFTDWKDNPRFRHANECDSNAPILKEAENVARRAQETKR